MSLGTMHEEDMATEVFHEFNSIRVNRETGFLETFRKIGRSNGAW